MSSELNGLQAKVKETGSQATFVHCYAHQFNLVLTKGVNYIKEVKLLFGTICKITTFFSKSTKRMHVLEPMGAPRLPTPAPTRLSELEGIVPRNVPVHGRFR